MKEFGCEFGEIDLRILDAIVFFLQKNLRCYNVAKLYYQVGDHESAKRYVSSYLEVRDGSASAHKLLGNAYEALGQKEAAFNEYKISLELEGRQNDLVLKGRELLSVSFSYHIIF